jgi:hypothetical protein
MDMVLNAIHDLNELQNGRAVTCDTMRGHVSFSVTMYGEQWEYSFTVTDIGRNRCGVLIGLCEDTPGNERMIEHEFALLDYVMLDRAKMDFTETQEEDDRILASRKGCSNMNGDHNE